MELFAKIVNGFQNLTTLAKCPVLDALQSSEYLSKTKERI